MSDPDKKDRIPLHKSTGPMLASRPRMEIGAHEDARDPIVQFFTSIPLFSLLTAHEVLQVLRICTIETYKAGQTIFEEGRAADSMLIIERGELEVTVRGSGGDVTVAQLGDGSVVGEMALIVGGPRTATVGAVTETRAYRLDGRDFELLRQQQSIAAYKILRKLLETLGERAHNGAQRIHDLFERPDDSAPHFERTCRDLIDRIQRALPQDEAP